jgi:hypothetical protein
MTRLGWADRAEQAFLVALHQRPALAPAHLWLSKLYRDYLRNPARARHHRNEFDRLSVLPSTSTETEDPVQGTDS